MEFLIELIHFIGTRLVENSAKRPKTPAAQQAFRKSIHQLRLRLLIIILAVSVLLPAYFFYDGYTSGHFSRDYFYIGIAWVITTFVSNLFTLTKALALFHPEAPVGVISESSTIHDDLRYEVGLLTLFMFLSAIPILNLVINSLSMDRALNVLEMTANTPQQQKTRDLAENMAFASLLIFLMSCVVFSIALIILGDTRKL